MNQRARIYELAQNGLEEEEIENQLKIDFGQSAFCKKTIYKWIARYKLGFKFDEKGERPGPKADEQLLARIIKILNDEPFSSTRSISRLLKEDNSTIWRYMTGPLGLVFKHSRWFPHILDNDQKLNRKRLSKQLSDILTSCQKESWRNIMTGDSSWFNFSYGNKGAWLLPEEPNPEMVKCSIGVKKILVTVIWGIGGFYIIDFLPEDESFNSTYFIDYILSPLFEKKQTIWHSSNKKRMWLHLDNCRVHNSKKSYQKYEEYGFMRPPHPAYSPDIAPSDFFLFGFAKKMLEGHAFTSPDEFKEKIIEIFESIPKETIKKTFKEWKERCDWVFSHNGAYYHKE